jgi:tetratricopeptide (TPR) repeat protein
VLTEEVSDVLSQARELEVRGDHPGIVGLLGELEEADLLDEPELGFLLATSLRRVGEARRALELTAALAAPCERSDRGWLARRRLNLEAALYFDRGAVAAAAERWSELVVAAGDAGDDTLLSNACNNLGVACTLLAQPDEAVAAYERALGVADRLGDRRGIAQAEHNLAIAYRELGLLQEATEHFERAAADAALIGSAEILGRAEEERALALLEAGDERLAEDTASRALARFRRAGDRVGEAEALRVLGIIALAGKHAARARAHLSEGLRLARAAKARLLEAEILEALATVGDVPGVWDRADAATMRTDAKAIFRAIGAEAWGDRVRARLVALLPAEAGPADSSQAGAPDDNRSRR